MPESGFCVSAFYGQSRVDRRKNEVRVAGYSRLPSRGARDGYTNPVDQAWDSKFYIDRNADGEPIGTSFKRRFCTCGAEIRRNSDMLYQCSNDRCAKIFTGRDDDWPMKVRYIR